MPLTVLPDAEAIFVQALAAQSSITAITSTRIGTRIPDTPTFPLIRLTKVAAQFTDEEGAEFATVEVECWADTDAVASTLARTVVACRKDLKGTYAAGWLALPDTTGPTPAPDPDSQRFRYMIDFDATVGA